MTDELNIIPTAEMIKDLESFVFYDLENYHLNPERRTDLGDTIVKIDTIMLLMKKHYARWKKTGYCKRCNTLYIKTRTDKIFCNASCRSAHRRKSLRNPL